MEKELSCETRGNLFTKCVYFVVLIACLFKRLFAKRVVFSLHIIQYYNKYDIYHLINTYYSYDEVLLVVFLAEIR